MTPHLPQTLTSKADVRPERLEQLTRGRGWNLLLEPSDRLTSGSDLCGGCDRRQKLTECRLERGNVVNVEEEETFVALGESEAMRM